MDPNLFHVDWERTLEAIGMVIILAFVVERSLALLFESRVWIERFDRPGLKELVAFGLSVAVCVYWQFDAVSIMILTDRVTTPGTVLTGALIAGGSKASIKLFHDLLNAKSTAYDNRHVIQAQHEASTAVEAAAKASESGTANVTTLARTADRAARRAERAALTSGSAAALDAAAEARKAAEKVAGLGRKARTPSP